MLVHDNELKLVTNPHTEADLGEMCVPVGRQFGLLLIKPSFSSCKVVCISIDPEMRLVVKRSLKFKTERNFYPIDTF